MADTTGERIAKVLARSGVASRREAEKLIEAGRVSVNGHKIDSPALNVTPRDNILVDGKPVAAPEPARMWLYYKPLGLVTSARDEKGRETVFDNLPEDMPRVMSVGRLDLNSEGLLLLTNDGEIKRRLELPATGWLRKYRVRVNGTPTEAMLDPLRKGITVEGERFQGMVVTLDRQQGANAWLTVGLREGRNREIRRAMEAVGLKVNRLIRVSYGPFKLGEMQPGEVQEIRQKTLREQLGLAGPADDTGTARGARRPPRPQPRAPGSDKPRPTEKGAAPRRSTDKATPAPKAGNPPAPSKAGPKPPKPGHTKAHPARGTTGPGTGRPSGTPSGSPRGKGTTRSR
ncbi:pseudouridine synthase [Halodurantibacterium flavum]|uniref:Pseudouridine synthase n=1 Tax=Halodurantibacterium flavum TaxID=1382802 RepID=A0ABW4SA41_9RHOB